MQALDGLATHAADLDVRRRAEALGDTVGETRSDDGGIPEIWVATTGLFDLFAVSVPLGFRLAGLHQSDDFLLVHFLILRCRVWNTRTSFQSHYPM